MNEENRIISMDKSIIPACDVETLEQLQKMMCVTKTFPQIEGYKVGFDLALGYGLGEVRIMIREEHYSARIIYDHQKAGTDIPATGRRFAKRIKDAGIDAAIIFPQAGPVTQEAWIKALQDEGVGVIVGGEMTHNGYKASEGGYINDDSLLSMYELAAKLGVTDFVVPGNRPKRIALYRERLEELGVHPVFYAPGFVAQGGYIGEAAEAAGDRWHAICGRAVFNPNNKENLDDVTQDEMRESITALAANL